MALAPDPHSRDAPATEQRPPWIVPGPDPRERALARTLGVPDLLARLLLARGLDDPAAARAHLRPDLRQLHDPFAFALMDRAVARVRDAVSRGEKIVIHGDYDVDGISGTVLLLKFFELMSADAKPYIPQRGDGYSFTEASRRAIVGGGYGLCISVDNGTNACEIIDQIQQSGCDVLVTDHHGTTENVANAHTVLNPRLPDAGYPDRELAGVGVAFCLAKAVATSFSAGKAMSDEFQEFLVDAMTYVALGTVADVAPLRGENRILVSHGLRAMAASRNPGVRALLDSANLSNRSPDSEDISFRIAPLINAAGRMGSAQEAVKLLMARGYQDAQQSAAVLEQYNSQRRTVERALYDRVMALALECSDPILILGDRGWHAGVLGIVAARIAETLHKPTVLIAIDDTGIGRGSGRSAGMLHLRDALGCCSDLLRGHGGHAAAAGLEIHEDQVDSLRARINERCGQDVRRLPAPRATAAAEFTDLEPQVVRKLDLLGPFGAANPRPVFATRAIKMIGRPTTDNRGQDVRFRVAKGGVILPARLKRGAHRFEEIRGLDSPIYITYSVRLAQWAEEGPVELLVHDLGPDSGHDPAADGNRTDA